jgi:hypothetical protein
MWCVFPIESASPYSQMCPIGGREQPPPLTPSVDEATFRRLLLAQGKKKEGGGVPNFVKKLDEVPEIDLPPTQPMSFFVSLADRALVRQFTGLWPSPQTTENWIQNN